MNTQLSDNITRVNGLFVLDTGAAVNTTNDSGDLIKSTKVHKSLCMANGSTTVVTQKGTLEVANMQLNNTYVIKNGKKLISTYWRIRGNHLPSMAY